MKEFLIKILNTPVTKAVLKDLKKWAAIKLINILQVIINKLEACYEISN